jgi:predicted DNA-binding protein
METGQTFTFRLPKPLRRKLAMKAQDDKRPEGWVVREILAAHFREADRRERFNVQDDGGTNPLGSATGGGE